jgi:hypothetical protein
VQPIVGTSTTEGAVEFRSLSTRLTAPHQSG